MAAAMNASRLSLDAVRRSVRSADGFFSLIDAIMITRGGSRGAAQQCLQRLLADDYLRHIVPHIQQRAIGGRGRPTPVVPLPVLVKAITLLPGRTALKWRLNAADVMCRALGGDEALREEIEAQRQVANTEHLRVCPDAQGWTPLQQLDFGIEEDGDESPAGLVYLAGSPEVSLVKVGSWSGDVGQLLSRYRMYYGPGTWVRAWQSEDRRRDETAVLKALRAHSAGGELIWAAAERNAARLIDRAGLVPVT